MKGLSKLRFFGSASRLSVLLSSCSCYGSVKRGTLDSTSRVVECDLCGADMDSARASIVFEDGAFVQRRVLAVFVSRLVRLLRVNFAVVGIL